MKHYKQYRVHEHLSSTKCESRGWQILKLTMSLFLVLFIAERSRASDEDLLYRELAPKPYDVQIRMQWGPTLRLPPDDKQEIVGDLQELLRRSVGSFWSIHIQQGGPLPVADLKLLRHGTFPLEHQVARKTFLVVVEAESGQWQLGVREGDHTTSQWSAMAEEIVEDRRLLASTLHRMIGRVFQPLYRIASIDRDRLDLIAVGGEWSISDESFNAFPEAGLARPVIVYRGREKEIQQIQILPLTYLSLDSRDRARITSRVISAYPAPLGSGRQSRVELWALGGKPLFSATELTLVLQGNSSRVLMGHRVVVQSKRFLKAETETEPLELLSDRHGRLSVETVEGFPVVWLYVWSGEALLARVPFVPGWNQRETLSLPDDSVRLRVEGELDRLRSDLVADVSRRAINRILLLAAAQAKDRDEVDRLKAERRSLPDEETYQDRLELILTGGVVDSEQIRSRVSVMRIRKSCDVMQKVIFRFLDPDRDRELETEVEALMKLP